MIRRDALDAETVLPWEARWDERVHSLVASIRTPSDEDCDRGAACLADDHHADCHGAANDARAWFDLEDVS